MRVETPYDKILRLARIARAVRTNRRCRRCGKKITNKGGLAMHEKFCKGIAK